MRIAQIIKIYVKTHFAAGDVVPVAGDWFVLEYIENQGMAFGTKFGSEVWHKLALSLFRIVAIGAIIYYWVKQLKQGARTEFSSEAYPIWDGNIHAQIVLFNQGL